MKRILICAIILCVAVFSAAALAEAGTSVTTGLPTEAETHILMVQLDNEPGARPQKGIASADIVYEYEVYNGGYTRYTAVFNDTVPELVEAVRSARILHVDCALDYNAAFIHYGGQNYQGSNVYQYMGKVGPDLRVDGMSDDKHFYRDTARKAPNNVVCKLQLLMNDINWNGVDQRCPFAFSETEYTRGSEAADSVTVSYRDGAYVASYTYDADSGLYLRFYNDEPYIDGDTGEQIACANVIVQYMTYGWYNDEADAPKVTSTGANRCDYFIDGTHFTGTWSRASVDDATAYYDEAGNEVVLKAGKTYVQTLKDTKEISAYSGGELLTQRSVQAFPAPAPATAPATAEAPEAEPEAVEAGPEATAETQAQAEGTAAVIWNGYDDGDAPTQTIEGLSPEEAAALYPDEELDETQQTVLVDDLMVNEALDDEGWWNILLLGSDSRELGVRSRSDSIVILSVHPETAQAKMTSIMRDTRVQPYGMGYMKITTANIYGGPEIMIRTVNEYFGMNITNYVMVDMQSLVSIIDLIGGVDLDITRAERTVINEQLGYDTYDFHVDNKTRLEEYGENVHLTGNQALAYARIRHLDSDYKRTERQRKTLIAIAKKLQECDVSTIFSVINTLSEYVTTNLTLSDMLQLASLGLSLDLSTVEQLRVPVDGTFHQGLSEEGVFYIWADFDQNKKLLHEFIYGSEN